jgi:hypothetical protein
VTRIIVVPASVYIGPPSTPVLTATANGTTQIDLAAAAIPGSGATVSRYYFEASNSSGGPFTALTNNATGLYSETGLSVGQTRYYRVYVVQSDAQQSGYSVTASATTSSTVKKWNPGHYMRLNGIGIPSTRSARVALADLAAANPNIKGILVTYPWGGLEPTQNNYNFAEVSYDLALCKARGLKLMGEVWWQKYGSTTADTTYFPQYIITGGGVKVVNGGGSLTVAVSNSTWSDRFIALAQAFAAAGFNADADFEQFVMPESASDTCNNWVSMVTGVGAAWDRTVAAAYLNWVDSAALTRSIVAAAAPYGMAIGAPDIIPSVAYGGPGEDHGSRVLQGSGISSVYNDGTNLQDFGSHDYRGEQPVSYSYEALSNMAPSILLPYATQKLKATHIAWSYSEDATLPANCRWSTGVLPALVAAGYPIVTTRPSQVA